MADQDNPTGKHEDPHQGDANAHPNGIPNSIDRLPNDADPKRGQDAPNAHPKQSVLIRLWRGLWRKRIFWHQRPDRPHVNWAEITTVCLTIGIVIAAFIQAFIYWKQAGIMQRSLTQNEQTIALNRGQVSIAGRNAKTAEDTLSEIQDSSNDTHELAVQAKNQADRTLAQANATNRLAEQAKRQADIAANTFEAEERPWVGMDHINPPVKIAVGTTPSSTLFYRNWGRGVAIHVVSEYRMQFFCTPFPTRPNFDVNTSPTPVLLMPGQAVETGKSVFTNALTPNDMLISAQPNCGLYAFARITYRDRGRREHWRHICGIWDHTTDNTFSICSFYNDGDEDYADGQEP
ncbi:MAG: hypothetical protein WA424_11820 [Candidatus Sulfotelmatobacter sp.]